MPDKCTACNGKRTIQTDQDLLDVFISGSFPLYKRATMKEGYAPNKLINLEYHTSNYGGEDGDIITSIEINKLEELGYKISSMGKNYVYLDRVN